MQVGEPPHVATGWLPHASPAHGVPGLTSVAGPTRTPLPVGFSQGEHWWKFKGSRREESGHFHCPLPLGPTLFGQPPLQGFQKAPSWVPRTTLSPSFRQ